MLEKESEEQFIELLANSLQKENNNLTKETEKLKEENKSILEEKAKMSAKMLEIIRNNNQLYDVHAKLYNEKRTNNSPSKAAPKENIIKLTPIPKSNNGENQIIDKMIVDDTEYLKYNESQKLGGDTYDAYGGTLIGCGVFLLYYGFWSLVILSLLYFIYVLGSDIFVLSKCEEKYKYIKQDGELFSRGRLGYVSV
jgi:hypothetical protein